jgi:class 3 adenylate cyclase
MPGKDFVDVREFLRGLRKTAKERIFEATEVVSGGLPIETDRLAISAPRWTHYPDVVAVSADLVASTQLSEAGTWQKSTAAIFDASVGPMVETLAEFGADFIDVQGDGGFGLYAGELAIERALCAAITISTFSRQSLEPLLEQKWPSMGPRTGFRIGVASSDLLAKRVGIPRSPHNAPIWAGRAVNYAVKVASQVGKHQIGVSAQVANAVRNNDYLYFSCGCAEGVPGSDYGPLWTTREFDLVAPQYANGMFLKSSWCETHGPDFCDKVLQGERRRDETKSQRGLLTQQIRGTR